MSRECAERLQKMRAAFEALETEWYRSTPAERRELVEIAKEATPTNCAWEHYGTAQYILRRAEWKI